MPSDASPLAGKAVLLTGASQGIGSALATQLLHHGARLTTVSRTPQQRPGIHSLALDLTQPDSRAHAVHRTLEQHGALDILINNAGCGIYQPAFRADMSAVRQMFELNFFAMLDLIQHAVPRLPRGGMIVNISSVLGLFSAPWGTLYAASKFAVTALGDGLRHELRSRGIHLLNVFPGYIETNFQQNVLTGKPPAALVQMRSPLMTITADQCARSIVNAIIARRKQLVVPSRYRPLVWLSRWAPPLFNLYLSRTYRRMEQELQ